MKKILLQISYILLFLLGIYFSLGMLASVVLIILEYTGGQMSAELIEEFPEFDSRIIYLGLTVFALCCGGIAFTCFFGVYAIKKGLRKLRP
ncbi:MAG: hypothetical protein KDD41_03575 [Flavobacteriales bacterium]|nr:hypothetical protein [Flavobacteriales bacterium]